MKRMALFLAAAALAASGCTSVVGTRSPEGALTITAKAPMFSSVEGLAFTATDQNGFSTTLSLQKQSVDSEAIKSLSSGMLGIAQLFIKAGPTNNPAGAATNSSR